MTEKQTYKDGILALASRKGGVSSEEVAAHYNKEIGWASRYVGGLVTTKIIISAKIGHRTCWYFTDQKNADAWKLTAPRPGDSKRSWRGPYVHRDQDHIKPALQTGEMIIPKGVKITRIPCPPPRNQVVPLLTDRPQPIRKTGLEAAGIKSRGF